jgi:hypothetical protein
MQRWLGPPILEGIDERRRKRNEKKNGSDLITFQFRRPFPWTQSLRPKGGVKPLRQ